jgi:DNA-binding SARP family transcriptional activator
LLAVLAVHESRGASREKLAALLWPESNETDARNSLKQVVYLLRRELGPNAILGSAELRLSSDLISCDLVTCQRLLAEGQLEPAVLAWTGPFLDGFHLGGDSEEFERWVDEERTRLCRLFRDALETLAAEATSRGDPRALSWWRRLAVIDPLDGRSARSIVIGLLALKDRPGALRHAEAYQALLHAELGLEPDAEFRELIASLRTPPGLSKGAHPAGLPAKPAPPHEEPVLRARSRERQAWVALAAAGALVGAVVVWISWAPPPPPIPVDPRRVALLASEPPGGDTAAASLHRRIVETVARQLATANLAIPVVLSPAANADARGAAVRAGAGLMVVVGGAGDREGVIEATLTDAGTGEQRWGTRSLPLTRGSVGAADSLAEQIATAVATRTDPGMRLWIGASSSPASLASYLEFSRGLALYVDLQPSAAAAHFRAAARDTGFTMALVMASWASYHAGKPGAADSIARALQPRLLRPLDRAWTDYQIAVFRRDLGAAYRAAAGLAAAAPGSEWRYLQAETALGIGRAGEAVRILEAMGPDLGWLAAFSGYWILLGRSLHFLEEHERELAAMDAAQRRFPANRIIAQMRIKALAALGRIAEVNAEVDRALTLRHETAWTESQPMDQAVAELVAHGYHDAAKHLASRTLTWIAQLPPPEQHAIAGSLPYFLFDAGETGRARRESQRLAIDDPGDFENIVFLAVLAADRGDRANALRIDSQLARVVDPRLRPDLLLGRAGIAASLHDRETAVRLIAEAFRAGFDGRTVIHIQAPLQRLRGYAPFDALVRPVE